MATLSSVIRPAIQGNRITSENPRSLERIFGRFFLTVEIGYIYLEEGHKLQFMALKNCSPY
jgi:hypothetical protein